MNITFNKTYKMRADYFKLTELSLMFLDPIFKTKFLKPGAMYHAWLMGKGLYYLKLALLMNNVKAIMNLSEDRVEKS